MKTEEAAWRGWQRQQGMRQHDTRKSLGRLLDAGSEVSVVPWWLGFHGGASGLRGLCEAMVASKTACSLAVTD